MVGGACPVCAMVKSIIFLVLLGTGKLRNGYEPEV